MFSLGIKNSCNNVPASSVTSLQRAHGPSTTKYKQLCISQQRQNMRRRMKMRADAKVLSYTETSAGKFGQLVQNCHNPYSLLLTIFTIVDQFLWRQYIFHLQVLIQKVTNVFTSSQGHDLEELAQLQGFMLQQKLEKMLNLSDKIFQEHLLILIHCMVAYNSVYHVIDEKALSEHLAHRHNYEKSVKEENLWLLTRMSVSQACVAKIVKNCVCMDWKSAVLPCLTILANYIAEEYPEIVQQLIVVPEFYQLVEWGLLSGSHLLQREAVLVCNNVILVGRGCSTYLLSQPSLLSHIQALDNEEARIFKQIRAQFAIG